MATDSSNEMKALEHKFDRLEVNSRYVIDEKMRADIIRTVKSGYAQLEDGDLQLARSTLYEAQHRFTIARFKNKVLFYYRIEGLAISFAYLIVFFIIGALAVYLPSVRQDPIVFPVLLAIVGGGIGGATAVISRLVGISLETKAVTTQVTWYVAKPVMGLVLGLITYAAFLTGLSLVSSSYQIDNPAGVLLIGFLGGYLEGFSTRVLNQVADRLAGIDKPDSSFPPGLTEEE